VIGPEYLALSPLTASRNWVSHICLSTRHDAPEATGWTTAIQAGGRHASHLYPIPSRLMTGGTTSSSGKHSQSTSASIRPRRGATEHTFPSRLCAPSTTRRRPGGCNAARRGRHARGSFRSMPIVTAVGILNQPEASERAGNRLLPGPVIPLIRMPGDLDPAASESRVVGNGAARCRSSLPSLIGS